jgi:hypothetical protein
MSHLSLVPPVTETAPAPAHARASVAGVPSVPAQRKPGSAWEDPNVVALSFFQAASGLCLCRSCSMKRHPAFGG